MSAADTPKAKAALTACLRELFEVWSSGLFHAAVVVRECSASICCPGDREQVASSWTSPWLAARRCQPQATAVLLSTDVELFPPLRSFAVPDGQDKEDDDSNTLGGTFLKDAKWQKVMGTRKRKADQN